MYCDNKKRKAHAVIFLFSLSNYQNTITITTMLYSGLYLEQLDERFSLGIEYFEQKVILQIYCTEQH